MILPLLLLAAQMSGSPPPSGTPQSVVPPPGSGTELTVECLNAEAMALGPMAADAAAKGALCLGYITGYLDGAKDALCLPPKPVMAVLHNYLQFMMKNARYHELPMAAGLRASIDANFPCRK